MTSIFLSVVTEFEAGNGLLDVSNANQACLSITRSLQGHQLQDDDKLASRFIGKSIQYLGYN